MIFKEASALEMLHLNENQNETTWHNMKWKSSGWGKTEFNALVMDIPFIMDAPERVGGENNWSIPNPFVLTALSTYTGMVLSMATSKNNLTRTSKLLALLH